MSNFGSKGNEKNQQQNQDKYPSQKNIGGPLYINSRNSFRNKDNNDEAIEDQKQNGNYGSAGIIGNSRIRKKNNSKKNSIIKHDSYNKIPVSDAQKDVLNNDQFIINVNQK